MKTKITLPIVFDASALEDAIDIIPELSLSDIEFSFVMRTRGVSDVTTNKLSDLKMLVRLWLTHQAQKHALVAVAEVTESASPTAN